jgi:hypothetical protein
VRQPVKLLVVVTILAGLFYFSVKNRKIRTLIKSSFTKTNSTETQGKKKSIYFLEGHNERDPFSLDDGGVSALRSALVETAYDVKGLNLKKRKKVPENASVVIVLGPKLPLLDSEFTALVNYARRGGRFLLAADPGWGHNLNNLSTLLGASIKENYIIDEVGQVFVASSTFAIGTQYSKSSKITKHFRDMSGFLLASSVEKASGEQPRTQIEILVKTNPRSFTVNKLSKRNLFDEKTGKVGPLNLVVMTSGKVPKSAQYKEPKEFLAIIVGDSDFLSNMLFDFKHNRELILNMISFLAKPEYQ